MSYQSSSLSENSKGSDSQNEFFVQKQNKNYSIMSGQTIRIAWSKQDQFEWFDVEPIEVNLYPKHELSISYDFIPQNESIVREEGNKTVVVAQPGKEIIVRSACLQYNIEYFEDQMLLDEHTIVNFSLDKPQRKRR